VCNGVYLQAGDLSRSPLEVTPLAGHVTGRFRAAQAKGFDVNPVTWSYSRTTASRSAAPIATACRSMPTTPSCERGCSPTSAQLYLRDPGGNLVEVDAAGVSALPEEIRAERKRLADVNPQDDENLRARLYLDGVAQSSAESPVS
jgi:hypothetical protein